MGVTVQTASASDIALIQAMPQSIAGDRLINWLMELSLSGQAFVSECLHHYDTQSLTAAAPRMDATLGEIEHLYRIFELLGPGTWHKVYQSAETKRKATSPPPAVPAWLQNMLDQELPAATFDLAPSFPDLTNKRMGCPQAVHKRDWSVCLLTGRYSRSK